MRSVRRDGAGFRTELRDGSAVTSRLIINATGTWGSPFVPYYPGMSDFAGRHIHTADYRGAEDLRDKHVVVVGRGVTIGRPIGLLLTRRSENATVRPAMTMETIDMSLMRMIRSKV